MIADSASWKHKTTLVSLSVQPTQVCVQQTTLDLLAKGYDVHVLADGCSSRSQVDRMFALEVSPYIPTDYIAS